MSEATYLRKVKQKKARNTENRATATKERITGSYFYPKSNLYTRQEFELLDTIFSDEPMEEIEREVEQSVSRDFWPQNKENLLNPPISRKNTLMTNFAWFSSGVILTSVISIVIFQLKIAEFKANDNIQIVFHKSAHITTEKTVDTDITSNLTKVPQRIAQTNTNTKEIKLPFFSNFFEKKPEAPKTVSKNNNQIAENKSQNLKVNFVNHTIQNGDSLWLIAKEYYGDPSPQNIKKIQDANAIRTIELLLPGKKLVIPL